MWPLAKHLHANVFVHPCFADDTSIKSTLLRFLFKDLLDESGTRIRHDLLGWLTEQVANHIRHNKDIPAHLIPRLLKECQKRLLDINYAGSQGTGNLNINRATRDFNELIEHAGEVHLKATFQDQLPWDPSANEAPSIAPDANGTVATAEASASTSTTEAEVEEAEDKKLEPVEKEAGNLRTVVLSRQRPSFWQENNAHFLNFLLGQVPHNATPNEVRKAWEDSKGCFKEEAEVKGELRDMRPEAIERRLEIFLKRRSRYDPALRPGMNDLVCAQGLPKEWDKHNKNTGLEADFKTIVHHHNTAYHDADPGQKRDICLEEIDKFEQNGVRAFVGYDELDWYVLDRDEKIDKFHRKHRNIKRKARKKAALLPSAKSHDEGATAETATSVGESVEGATAKPVDNGLRRSLLRLQALLCSPSSKSFALEFGLDEEQTLEKLQRLFRGRHASAKTAPADVPVDNDLVSIMFLLQTLMCLPTFRNFVLNTVHDSTTSSIDDLDAIGGRGGLANKQKGNKLLRQMIVILRQFYEKRNKSDKGPFALAIYETLVLLGIRIFEKDGQSIMSQKKAVEKIKQLFRDTKPAEPQAPLSLPETVCEADVQKALDEACLAIKKSLKQSSTKRKANVMNALPSAGGGPVQLADHDRAQAKRIKVSCMKPRAPSTDEDLEPIPLREPQTRQGEEALIANPEALFREDLASAESTSQLSSQAHAVTSQGSTLNEIDVVGIHQQASVEEVQLLNYDQLSDDELKRLLMDQPSNGLELLQLFETQQDTIRESDPQNSIETSGEVQGMVNDDFDLLGCTGSEELPSLDSLRRLNVEEPPVQNIENGDLVGDFSEEELEDEAYANFLPEFD